MHRDGAEGAPGLALILIPVACLRHENGGARKQQSKKTKDSPNAAKSMTNIAHPGLALTKARI
jgi:hypothetical protein